MDELTITPRGHLLVRQSPGQDPAPGHARQPSAKTLAAFRQSPARGLLALAMDEPDAPLEPAFDFARGVGRLYVTALCRVATGGPGEPIPELPPPAEAIDRAVAQAPPMPGLEYLDRDAVADWWRDLDRLVRDEVASRPEGISGYLAGRDDRWRLVGRVTLHLAENKRAPDYPFAFLATFANGLTPQGKVRHEPLSRALGQHAGAQDRDALLGLLVPILRAAEASGVIRELVDSGAIYRPLAWSARQAYDFLREVPLLESSGLIVRVPDWWHAQKPPRPVVSVKVDTKGKTDVGVDAMLDFSVDVSLDGEPLTSDELVEMLEAGAGLVPLRGKWVEVDRDKLREALDHWKTVEAEVRREGISFFEGMRLLSGAALDPGSPAAADVAVREWSGLTAGPRLEATLRALRSPEARDETVPLGLRATLRPYQQAGYAWLRFVARLGLGACLADDMGLGKTVQVIALLLDLRRDRGRSNGIGPSLLVVPASLIANWKAELARFAPDLTYAVAHPSEVGPGRPDVTPDEAGKLDLIVTTYGMLSRTGWIREHRWRLAILDEAQAIKNSGTKQARAVKELTAASRVAMTGTPVENRLSDLWSLFDFLNPGLLGSAKQFAAFVKRLQSMDPPSYEPLHELVRPYILRRLKTDKRVIADLPDKSEVRAYCPLTKHQAALYQHALDSLKDELVSAEGIQRRGIVLAQLMRLKQICNHPAQATGTNDYDPARSGKFARLAEIVEEVADRQEKMLVFTQFREVAGPLADYLAALFGRPGLILHGGTGVRKRQEAVAQFQREDGPPFFVLSLKAGGTGLNLTAASHVVHFDRWWNPAVEDQATDRAFRIGQKRNVLVHKFVCRGTIEERIDEMIESKSRVAGEVLGTGGAETLLTEMDDDTLMDFVRLDLRRAMDG